LERDHKRVIKSWQIYDWANSAFAATIMAAVLPQFYSSVAGSTLNKTTATSYWGYSNTIAMMIIVIIAPVLGAISDHSRAKKKFLAICATIGIISTAFLAGTSNGMWLYASIVYIFGRIGFAGGNIFYDSLLPHVAGPDEIDKVSAEGYAYGYLGGGILLAINLLMVLKPSLFCIPDAQWGARISFITVSVWWTVFSIPIFKNVPEPYVVIPGDESPNPLLAGYQRIKHTLTNVRNYKELVKFLIAFWLYNDGITTIIVMAVIFGAEIGIGTVHLIGSILMVQFLGVPFTVFFGRLPKKFGTKNSLLLSLGIYSIIVILGYFMQNAFHFWILAFLVSMVQGGSQALSRSMFGSMVPMHKSAEFFGFYDMSGKFSGIIGPFIFGITGQLTGSSRISIISIIVFFLIGALVLAKVDHKAGINASSMPDDSQFTAG
jgi:MFS transporter, UMF1 family